MNNLKLSQSVLERFSRFRTVEANETIIHKGDDDSEVYFILSGLVRVVNFSSKGREIWYAELGAGTFLGEMSALLKSKRTSNVIAQTETKLAILTRDEFFNLIRHDSEIAIWIMQELVRRVGEQTEKMSTFVAQTVSERVRSTLFHMAIDCEHSTDDKLVIKPVPNISAIALRLNTERETVSREISALNRAQIIEKTKEQILICKPDFLHPTG